uniref:Serine/threonine-protein kinase B n=1 Tax=Lygus hesperus TaxID=30085 RepID=A0A0A9VWV7_LYGHE
MEDHYDKYLASFHDTKPFRARSLGSLTMYSGLGASKPCTVQSSCILRRLGLIDFGLASTCVDALNLRIPMSSSSVQSSDTCTEWCGTAAGTSIYIAPELLSNVHTKMHPVHTYTRSDIYSIGVTLLYDV